MGTPVILNPEGFDDWAAVMALLQAAFAGMTGRVAPPSSLLKMSVADLAAKARVEDFYLIGPETAPRACLFASRRGDAYYLGKLATAPAHQGQGLARALISAARIRARDLGGTALELETRIELTENHAVFAAFGFHVTGQSSHPGFDRPTSLTFRAPL